MPSRSGSRPSLQPLLLAALVGLGCSKSGTRSVPDAGGGVADAGLRVVAEPLSAEERAGIGYRLAFLRRLSPENAQVFLVNPAGETPEQALTSGLASHFPAGAFPTGELLVLAAVGGEEAHLEQLMVWPLKGEAKPRTLGPASPRTRSPVISPDGKKVAFESGAKSFSDLFLIDREGRSLQRLTENVEGNFEPTFSSDGKQLVFASSRTGDPELYRMTLGRKKEERLTTHSAEDLAPRYSPSGELLAFISTRGGTDQVHLMSPEGTGLTRVHTVSERAGEPQVGPEPVEQDLAWSPDGKRLAYAARVRNGKMRIWVYELEGKKVAPLTDGAVNDGYPVWSPDGKYLAFVSDEKGNWDVWVMRADGSARTAVVQSPAAETLPLWVPASSSPP